MTNNVVDLGKEKMFPVEQDLYKRMMDLIYTLHLQSVLANLIQMYIVQNCQTLLACQKQALDVSIMRFGIKILVETKIKEKQKRNVDLGKVLFAMKKMEKLSVKM